MQHISVCHIAESVFVFFLLVEGEFVQLFLIENIIICSRTQHSKNKYLWFLKFSQVLKKAYGLYSPLRKTVQSSFKSKVFINPKPRQVIT